MTQAPEVLTTERYVEGLSWSEFLAENQENKAIFTENYAGVELAELTRHNLVKVAQRYPALHALAIGMDWCPDTQRGLPIAVRLVELIPGATMRIFPRDSNKDVMAKFLTQGQDIMPVIAFLDENYQEIGRWIEQPAVAKTPEAPGPRYEEGKSANDLSEAALNTRYEEDMHFFYPNVGRPATIKELLTLLGA